MSSTRAHVQDDDEDLDDLDDIVDQFESSPKVFESASKPPTSSSATPNPTASSSKPTPQSSSSSSLPDGIPDDIVKQFTANMEAFMRELGGGLDESEKDSVLKNREAFEKMLVDGMNGVGLGGDSGDDEDIMLPLLGNKGKSNVTAATPPQAGSSKQSGAKDDFQKNIRQTMDKLKESESTIKNKQSSPDPLEKLWGDLANQLGDDNIDNDEDMQGMLETMMQQLMSKEILYEPLKELKEQFPKYLSDNRDKLSAEDKQRYEAQHKCVTKIIELFEDPTYSEENLEKNVQIVTVMNEMQSYGSPPTEIMGPLPPGFDMGPDGMPKMPDGCIIA